MKGRGRGERAGLVVVDMQRYYLEAGSDFSRFHESRSPGATEFIRRRAEEVVVPNIRSLLAAWRGAGWPVFYLRLCGVREDRSDLHRFFRGVNEAGAKAGYTAIYPREGDAMSEVVGEIAPGTGDRVYCKTTFSGFTSGGFASGLEESGIGDLVFVGLATSQCVETTARDASDRGYRVIQVEDAQADYTESAHRMSLMVSRGVCGGAVVRTADVLALVPVGLGKVFALEERV